MALAPCREACKTNWSSYSFTSRSSCNSETRSHYQTPVCNKSQRKSGWLLEAAAARMNTHVWKHLVWISNTHTSLCGSGFAPVIHWEKKRGEKNWKTTAKSRGYFQEYGNCPHVCRLCRENQRGNLVFWLQLSVVQIQLNSFPTQPQKMKKTFSYSIINQLATTRLKNPTCYYKDNKVVKE